MEETIFDSLNEEFYLSCNNKWDILRKLSKKINIDDELTEDSKQKADTGVQLLPRQDVLLFGTLPKMEQRVYSKCRECRLIFNPRDILKHKDCTAKLYEETIHPSLLKKQQKQLAKAKANSNKKPIPGTVSASTPLNPTVFKKPRTPPPIKPKSPISRPPPVPSPLSAPNPLLELKVSVAKVVLPKVPKVTTVTSSTTSSTNTMTTSSSEKHHEIRVCSATSSTATKSSSGHHSPKSPSKNTSHSTFHSSSSHRSSSSKDSHKSSRSTSSTPDSHSSRSASKSSTGESHSSKSVSKTTPMDTQHHSQSKSSKMSTSSESSHSSTHLSRSASKGIPLEIHSHSKSSSHTDSHSSSRKSSFSSSTTTPMDTLPPPSRTSTSSTSSSSSYHHLSRHSTESSRSSSTSSSSRHKKSKKSNTSSTNSSTSPNSTSSSGKSTVFDPDVHCGVVEGTKGPCTRSVTCSNHRIQLRKLVPGRSKDIHQLIAERKAAKEKDAKHTPFSYTAAPNAEAKDSAGQNTSYVVIMAKLVSTVGNTESPATVTTSYVPIMPKIPVGIHSRPLITSKMSDVLEKEADSPRTIVNGYVNQTTFDTSPQDVYMPMSPISVASPVQFVKIGNKMMCLETPQSAKTPAITKNSPIFIQMPMNQPTPNIRTYKSHPKPTRVLTYGTRKMGGAILFSNRRLEGQRNAFLTKLRPHVNKTVNKRPASEKLVTSDSKKLVSEVNGFFLHVDMSEASDSPQSNNLIQDKILFSMK